LLKDILEELPELEEGKKIISTLSGGFDSTIMLHLLVKKYGLSNVEAISFNYGQRHNVELEMAKKSTKRLGVPHKIVDISFLGDMVSNVSSMVAKSDIKIPTVDEVSGDPQPSSYVPNRNMILLSLAASYAEANNGEYIVLSNNGTDLYGYHDATPEFSEKMNTVFELNRKNHIELISPFAELYKEDEAVLAKELSEVYGFDIIEYHWSCYNGDDGSGKECGLDINGNCPTCREKMIGMFKGGYSKEYIKNRFKGTQNDFKNFFKEIE